MHLKANLSNLPQPQFLPRAVSFACIALFFSICSLLQVNDPNAMKWFLMYFISGVVPSAWSSYQAWTGHHSKIVFIDLVAAASIPLLLIASNGNEARLHFLHVWIKQGAVIEVFAAESVRDVSGCLLVLIALFLNAGYHSITANGVFVLITFLALFSWANMLTQGSEMVNGFAEHCRGILGVNF
jgi:hypothetical protein